MENCRQIIEALRAYARQHDGKYPDSNEVKPANSNQAFRLLILSGVVQDETIFSGVVSRYTADNLVGAPPDFVEILESGENHWAMTKGVTDKSPPKMPLVFENAVSNTWPPKWNASAAHTKEPGRSWEGGKIIVGFNDGSVEVIQLESAKGTSVGPKKGADGKDVFTRAAELMQILDIER